MKLPRWQRLSILAALVLAGCDQGAAPPEVVALNGNVAAPATDYTLLSAFTAALPCAGQPLAWSIREQGTGWTAVDGAITQAGVWTSPGCGSSWLGQTLHVDAKCSSTGQTASAAIATVPETVSGVEVAYAVRVTPLPSCIYPTPNPSGLAPGTQIQFYGRVVTTCGEVVTPTPPASWPAACP